MTTTANIIETFNAKSNNINALLIDTSAQHEVIKRAKEVIKSNSSNILDDLEAIMKLDTAELQALNPLFNAGKLKYLLMHDRLSQIDTQGLDKKVLKMIDDILFVAKMDGRHILDITRNFKDISLLKKYASYIEWDIITAKNADSIIGNIMTVESYLKSAQYKPVEGKEYIGFNPFASPATKKAFGTLYYYLRGFNGISLKLEHLKPESIQIIAAAIRGVNKAIQEDTEGNYRFNVTLGETPVTVLKEIFSPAITLPAGTIVSSGN